MEVIIAADADRIWDLTQNPEAHTRWDARFSRITPHGTATDSDGAWRFTYERRMFGHTIRGTGISLGSRTGADGVRTSALRFTTDDRLSPLREGRGFWRYEPVDGGVRFVTGYDYSPGWGRLTDRAVRPIVAWLTAYSFARLRRWAELDEAPERWPVWRGAGSSAGQTPSIRLHMDHRSAGGDVGCPARAPRSGCAMTEAAEPGPVAPPAAGGQARSMFAAAMGDDFERLHPMLQRRFGVSLAAGYACVG